jgi:3-oxoacyl-[acyl-carrier protein] reductase
MKQRGGGAIVNVSSVAGIQGIGSSIAYAASKAALNAMTKSLARAFAPEIRVNAVAPGPVLTRWLAPHRDRIEQQVAQTPMRRAATPDDIADVVVFLATGTTLMTGQVVIVDGGRTM